MTLLTVELQDWGPGHPLDGARLVQTCVAVPTQYDVLLTDGRALYFRYRSAHWSLHLDGPGGPCVTGEFPERDDLDGMLDPGEVLDLLWDLVPVLLSRLDAGDAEPSRFLRPLRDS